MTCQLAVVRSDKVLTWREGRRGVLRMKGMVGLGMPTTRQERKLPPGYRMVG